ncbi:uncharacterized protein LOC106157739 [Lingula anatina]|uniref:Uncharacterized protein LOC106157739 n=1 Tax=Lingula anatina TaxID=7574 RepID=A0A1S3HTQ8_LINAN|nr:uncharacterized protein LOC106157739 [Lingula anatina]|eukprot:XP_013388931.1 uncharacterized protein LOC106157739 [Lingula anatina]
MDPDPGVNGVSRIVVEEVRLGKPQFADQPQVAQQVFNLRHWNWYNLDFTGLSEIESMIYPKMSFDSGLRVSMTATVMTSQARAVCTKWEFRFDRQLCPVSTHVVHGVRNTNSYQTTTQHLFPITVSGICTGLPAGNLVLSIHTSSCGGSPVDAVTGWQTSFFVSAEEVVLP